MPFVGGLESWQQVLLTQEGNIRTDSINIIEELDITINIEYVLAWARKHII